MVISPFLQYMVSQFYRNGCAFWVAGCEEQLEQLRVLRVFQHAFGTCNTIEYRTKALPIPISDLFVPRCTLASRAIVLKRRLRRVAVTLLPVFMSSEYAVELTRGCLIWFSVRWHHPRDGHDREKYPASDFLRGCDCLYRSPRDLSCIRIQEDNRAIGHAHAVTEGRNLHIGGRLLRYGCHAQDAFVPTHEVTALVPGLYR